LYLGRRARRAHVACEHARNIPDCGQKADAASVKRVRRRQFGQGERSGMSRSSLPGRAGAGSRHTSTRGRAGVLKTFWNRRFYLEPLESDVGVDDRLLEVGDIACLGAETEVSIGSHRFRWILNPMPGGQT
jgi:hypothetical protein